MKKTIDFKTNFNEITEEDIDNILQKGTKLYSTESYSENHPFVSPKLITSLYKYGRYLLWIEIIDADDGLCKTIMHIQNQPIHVITDSYTGEVMGYCTSDKSAKSYLVRSGKNTGFYSAKITETRCLDSERFTYRSKVTFIYNNNFKQWDNPIYIEKVSVCKSDDVPYIKCNIDDNGVLSITIYTITHDIYQESIEENANLIFTSLLNEYPVFKDGLCHAPSIIEFNEKLKNEFSNKDTFNHNDDIDYDEEDD